MTVAIPGRSQPDAPTTYKPHPHSEHALGCPNCHGTDLVASYAVTVEVQVQAWRIDLVTRPEVDPDPGGTVSQPRDISAPTKVACPACRWSYTGPDAIGKLVPA